MNSESHDQTTEIAAAAAREQRGAESSEAPQGPVPALSPPKGGRSPARPSSSAVGGSDPAERPLNSYEAKQEARRGRLLAASGRAAGDAEQMHGRASAMAAVIPLGQPILVGHHSEGRDRRYRARFGRLYERSFEAQQRSQELRTRAAAVGTGGISADDPAAVEKLRAELADLESAIARMKAVNSAHNAFHKRPESLASAPISEADKARCRAYKPTYSWEPHPFAPFQLSNAGANVRRIRKRIEELEARAATPAREPIVGEGWTITDDVSDNRIAVTFEAIPSETVRTRLKRAGFRWSPHRGAWVRQRTNAGWAAAIYAMGTV